MLEDTMEKSAEKTEKTGKTGSRAADLAWLAGLSGNWFKPAFGGDGRRSGEMPGVVVLMCSLPFHAAKGKDQAIPGRLTCMDLRDSRRSGGCQ